MAERKDPLRLRLYDDEWPRQQTTHTRMIARAIVVDDEGNGWFIRVDRNDDFGKAFLIETAGGGVEEGETPEEALRRELWEEIGAEVEILCPLGVIEDDYNLIGRHNVNHYFLCRLLSRGSPHLTRMEREQLRLSPLCLAMDMVLEEYEKGRRYPLGRLIANREEPVLRYAMERMHDPEA